MPSSMESDNPLGPTTMTRIDATPSLPGLPPPLPVGAQVGMAPPPVPPSRVGSIDAYRGLVMFLMMAEVLQFCAVKGNVKGSDLWAFLCHHQSHAEWIGCSLHDLIQPSFSFLVGVALPFSVASRL